MSNVTFFRDRQQKEGEACTIHLKAPRRSTRVFVFGRRSLDRKLLRNWEGTEQEIDSTIAAVIKAVREQEGGCAVVLRDGEEKVEFFFSPETGAPGSIGVLGPGRPFRWEAVNGKAQALPRGSQLFVPVDPRAEQALQRFKEDLECLPPDMESLVWHALRRPSLDARIDRLEAKIFGRTAVQEQERERIGFVDRLASSFRKPAIRWSAIALALALVALLGFGSYEIYRAVTSPVPPAPPPAPPDPVIADVAQRLEEILRTVETRKENVALELTKLANAHQRDLQDMNADKIAQLFMDEPSKELDRLLLVPIKLQVLKLQIPKLDESAPDINFLGEPNSLAPTMAALESIKQEIANDAAAQNLFASLSCRFRAARPESPPPLPTAAAGVSGKLCKDFPLTKAIPGLKAIPEFIKQYGGAGQPPAAPAPETTGN